jgi:hypothetical protein
VNKEEKVKVVQDILDKYMHREDFFIQRLWRFHYRRLDIMERLTEISRLWLEDDEECTKKRDWIIKTLSSDDHFPYLVEVIRKGLDDEIDKDRDPRP